MMRKGQREKEHFAEPRLTTNQLVTIADLEYFKQEILNGIREIIGSSVDHQPKTWYKSYEVMKLLTISANTLQGLRNNGKLPYSKIGGVFYYSQRDVEQMLESHKRSG